MCTSPILLTAIKHWHGISQKGSVQMDGAAFVTQCPIVPGHSFLWVSRSICLDCMLTTFVSYNFSTEDQSGTYWYHSHLHTQYCDGLRGPLVVYARPDPRAALYDVDDGRLSICNGWMILTSRFRDYRHHSIRLVSCSCCRYLRVSQFYLN